VVEKRYHTLGKNHMIDLLAHQTPRIPWVASVLYLCGYHDEQSPRSVSDGTCTACSWQISGKDVSVKPRLGKKGPPSNYRWT